MTRDPHSLCSEQIHKRGVGTIKCGKPVKSGFDKCPLHVRTDRQHATRDAELAELSQRHQGRGKDASVRAREIAAALDMGHVLSLDDGSVQLDELASKSLLRLLKANTGGQLQL